MSDQERQFRISDLAHEDPVFGLLRSGRTAQGQNENVSPAEAVPTIEVLVRYFAGALPELDARAAEAALTRSRTGRAMARDVRRILDSLQVLTLSEVQAIAVAEVDSSASEAARTWIQVAHENLEALGQLMQPVNPASPANPADVASKPSAGVTAGSLIVPDSIDIWSVISSWGESRRREATALLSTLDAFSAQLRNSMRRSGPAFARGADLQTLSFHSAQNAECVLTQSYISASGDLQCVVQLTDSDGGEFYEVDGHVATLFLLSPSGAGRRAVGASRVKRGRAIWTIPHIGEMLGFVDAPLSARHLAVSVSGSDTSGTVGANGTDDALEALISACLPAPKDSASRWFASVQSTPITDAMGTPVTMYASIIDSEGLETTAIPMEVKVAPLHAENGELMVCITLPTITRAAYPTWLLVADLAVGPGEWQRVGAWPVADWQDAELKRPVPLPGVAGPIALPFEALRIQFQDAHPQSAA